MKKGTVLWFDARRGYGFIGMEDGTDIFVHHSEIQMDGFKKLMKGQEVEFDIKDGTNGRTAACNVRPVAD